MSGEPFDLAAESFDLAAARARFAGLRVALVHDWLNGMRGGEKVLETIGLLFPGAPIHTLIAQPDKLSPQLRAHPIVTSKLQGYPGIQRHYRHFLPLFPSAIEDFDLQAFDLVISTSHCVAKGAIPGPQARHFSYCHSPMRYAWDQEHVYFPERRGPLAWVRGHLLSHLRVWDVTAGARVDHFWANSRFVAERIARYYRREAEVLPPPIDLRPFQEAAHNAIATSGVSVDAGNSGHEATSSGRIGRRGRCLAVSALVPYKRLDLAILACERLGLELRIVGTGPEYDRLARLAGPRTELLGRVDGARLVELYREADLFLQPGVEDFGMASVETLAAGTPVVALGRGGILDIVDDGIHGILYADDEVEGLMKAIDKALDFRFNPLDLIQRAEAFSVDNFLRRLAGRLERELALDVLPARPTVSR